MYASVGYLTASLPTLVSFTCCLHVGGYNDTRITLSHLIACKSIEWGSMSSSRMDAMINVQKCSESLVEV